MRRHRTTSAGGAQADAAALMAASATQTWPLVPRAIADGVVTMPGSHACAVLEVGAVNLALLHPDELAGLASAYHGFLAGLSFPVQVLVRVQPADPTSYLQWYQAQTARRAASDPALRWLVTRHLAHVRALVSATVPLAHRFYVVIPAPASTSTVARPARWASGAILHHLPRWHRQQDAPYSPATPPAGPMVAEALAERCGLVAAALGTAGLPVHRLNDAELAALWYSCLCPQNAALQPLPLEASLAPVQPVATLEVSEPGPSPTPAPRRSTALPP